MLQTYSGGQRVDGVFSPIGGRGRELPNESKKVVSGVTRLPIKDVRAVGDGRVGREDFPPPDDQSLKYIRPSSRSRAKESKSFDSY